MESLRFYLWNYLRNELNFWNVHRVMNTSGLLQSKWTPKGFTLTLQEIRSIRDSMNIPKLNLLLIFTFYYKYLKYKKNVYNLGIKTVLHLKYNRINGLVGVGTGSLKEQTRDLFCMCDSGVVRYQSQHQYHFWRMSSMFEAYCTRKWDWQLSIKFVQSMRLWTVAKI